MTNESQKPIVQDDKKPVPAQPQQTQGDTKPEKSGGQQNQQK